MLLTFFLLIFQVERAFQKQQGVNLNRNIKFIGKKTKSTRLHRNVGLGFKTPKEVNKRNETVSVVYEMYCDDIYHDGLLKPT